MNYRSSPPLRAVVLDRNPAAAVAIAAETFGAGAFLASAFRGIRTSGHSIADGVATPIIAGMPDAHQYDKLTFLFNQVLASGTYTAGTLTLFILQVDPGGAAAPGTQRAVPIGTSTFAAGTGFPPITVPQYDAKYFVAWTAVTGAAPVGQLFVSVAGNYEDWRK